MAPSARSSEPAEKAEWDVPVPDLSAIVTEDDEPVDNLGSEKQQRLLTEPLYASWQGPPSQGGAPAPFLVAANVGLFGSPHEDPVVPDVMFSRDVTPADDLWKKEHRSYFIWEFGKPPDLALEIVSNRKGKELGPKRHKYARWRVSNYVVFDPAHILGPEVLQCFELRGDLYVPTQPQFEWLGLGLQKWSGDYEGVHAQWLRWTDSDGQLIRTGAEQRERAEQEKQRAEQEKQRAESAEARIRELEQRLERQEPSR
jgi:hypothetical protein